MIGSGPLGVRRRCFVLGSLAALAVLAAIATPFGIEHGLAQESPLDGELGRISGVVRSGTAGVRVSDAMRVDLITMSDDHGVVGERQTIARNGRYEFRVQPDPQRLYVLRAVHQGVQYVSDSVRLSPARPVAEQNLVVYDVTTETPPLSIYSTIVTVVNVDRSYGLLSLMREDQVQNPGDRIFVGDEAGLTLRLPVPDRTIDAAGRDESSKVTFSGATVGVATPLRPGLNAIMTHYVVAYDYEADVYRLRVLAPLPTTRIEARIPEHLVRGAEPLDGAGRPERVVIDGQPMAVVSGIEGAPSLVVDLEGISVHNAPNALTGQPTAGLGALLAILVLAVAAAVAGRMHAAPAPATEEQGAAP
jgi:hypothetical protein